MIITDYELVERIGESEMWTTFQGKHRHLSSRLRAIKMPKFDSEYFSEEELQPQFKSDIFRLEVHRNAFAKYCETMLAVAKACDLATSAEKESLQSIITIESIHFDPEKEMRDDRPYQIMEWIEGSSVAKEIAKGAMKPARAVTVLSSVLNALQILHAQEIFHGNIKPANILLTAEDKPKLTDFGANVLEFGMPPRRSAIPYLSPQQIEGQPVEKTSDIFSLTLVLYEMLTGKKAERFLTADQFRIGCSSEFTSLDIKIGHGLI